MLMFFLVVVGVLSLIYGYIGWRIILPLSLQAPWNTALWITLFVFMVLPFIPMLLRNSEVSPTFLTVISWVSFVGLGFFFLLFTFLILKDSGWGLFLAFKKLSSFFASSGGSTSSMGREFDPDRRLLLTNMLNLGTLGMVTVLTGYGIYEARRKPAIVSLDVPIPNLPEDLNGFRIVQITDLHVGLTVHKDWVEKIVDIVNSLAADVLVFTGDLADGTVAQLKEDVRPLAKLKTPHGCFFITGNHEYYSGVGEWLKEVERLGMKVLLNAHQVIEKGEGRLVIGGIPDPTGKQYSPEHIPNPSKAFSGAPSCDVSILLAHQPRSVFQAAEVGFDLMISGHTHGGQFFPWNFLVTLEQPYLSGMHRHKVKQGEGLVYVSRGTGYWGPPIRLGSRSEVTVFRLVPAAQS